MQGDVTPVALQGDGIFSYSSQDLVSSTWNPRDEIDLTDPFPLLRRKVRLTEFKGLVQGHSACY